MLDDQTKRAPTDDRAAPAAQTRNGEGAQPAMHEAKTSTPSVGDPTTTSTDDKPPENERASPEQLVYADLLDLGMKIGLAGMVAFFVLYVSGLVAPHIPLADLPQYWSLPVHEYLEKSGAPTGWGWAKLLGKGDFLNILPVAFLSTITIVCYARILPMLRAKGDNIYATIVVAEIVVLALAASGILAGGH